MTLTRPTGRPTAASCRSRTSRRPTARDIWALPLEAGTAPFVLAQTRGADNDARFSPDARAIFELSVVDAGGTTLVRQAVRIANGEDRLVHLIVE